jgi:hypothetical protein
VVSKPNCKRYWTKFKKIYSGKLEDYAEYLRELL